MLGTGRADVQQKIQLSRKDQEESLQSHWLAPVSLNGERPLPFAVELSRSRTLVSARTVESLGVSIEAISTGSICISEDLVYPLIRLVSLGVGDAVLKDFEVVVWGRPVLSPKVVAGMGENTFRDLGNRPQNPIDAIIDCRGVLGLDFLDNFLTTFDLHHEMLILQQ